MEATLMENQMQKNMEQEWKLGLHRFDMGCYSQQWRIKWTRKIGDLGICIYIYRYSIVVVYGNFPQ